MDPYDYEPEGAGGYGWYGDASSDGVRAGQRGGKGELGDGGVGKVDLRSVACVFPFSLPLFPVFSDLSCGFMT